jgi:hypothetical protein
MNIFDSVQEILQTSLEKNNPFLSGKSFKGLLSRIATIDELSISKLLQYKYNLYDTVLKFDSIYFNV